MFARPAHKLQIVQKQYPKQNILRSDNLLYYSLCKKQLLIANFVIEPCTLKFFSSAVILVELSQGEQQFLFNVWKISSYKLQCLLMLLKTFCNFWKNLQNLKANNLLII